MFSTVSGLSSRIMKVIITISLFTLLGFTTYSQSQKQPKAGFRNIIDIVCKGDTVISKTHHLLINKDAILYFKKLDSVQAAKKYRIRTGEDVYLITLKKEVKLLSLPEILEVFNIPVEKRALPIRILYNPTRYSSEILAKQDDISVLIRKDSKTGEEYLSIVYYPWWRFENKKTYSIPNDFKIGRGKDKQE